MSSKSSIINYARARAWDESKRSIKKGPKISTATCHSTRWSGSQHCGGAERTGRGSRRSCTSHLRFVSRTQSRPFRRSFFTKSLQKTSKVAKIRQPYLYRANLYAEDTGFIYRSAAALAVTRLHRLQWLRRFLKNSSIVLFFSRF
jgi:hypothetical protein